uniref:Uncharacterized protein n=1 Tax=Sphaerodactylus townsendi TaxID=933632 RepID=A0ACB8FUU0_9SAUR
MENGGRVYEETTSPAESSPQKGLRNCGCTAAHLERPRLVLKALQLAASATLNVNPVIAHLLRPDALLVKDETRKQNHHPPHPQRLCFVAENAPFVHGESMAARLTPFEYLLSGKPGNIPVQDLQLSKFLV